ncbi:MAG TPA: ORF6N domain-containing protein [Lacunisphaera sp.]
MPSAKTDSLSGRILTIRGQRVILDTDLARLYEVTTSAFNQSIRRNAARFPADFAFQLTVEEANSLRSQFVILNAGIREVAADLKSQFVTSSSIGRGRHRKYRPWVFTEHGAVMAANVLRSAKATAMSVYVVRAFVRMKEELTTSAVIFRRLAEIDKKLVTHDVILRDIYEKLRPLLVPPALPRKEMGFHVGLRKTKR